MIQVSSREFRENQKMYLDLADKGEQILLRRGKKHAYMLKPLSEDDLYWFTPEIMEHLQKAIDEAKQGEVKSLTDKEWKELLGL